MPFTANKILGVFAVLIFSSASAFAGAGGCPEGNPTLEDLSCSGGEYDQRDATGNLSADAMNKRSACASCNTQIGEARGDILKAKAATLSCKANQANGSNDVDSIGDSTSGKQSGGGTSQNGTGGLNASAMKSLMQTAGDSLNAAKSYQQCAQKMGGQCESVASSDKSKVDKNKEQCQSASKEAAKTAADNQKKAQETGKNGEQAKKQDGQGGQMPQIPPPPQKQDKPKDPEKPKPTQYAATSNQLGSGITSPSAASAKLGEAPKAESAYNGGKSYSGGGGSYTAPKDYNNNGFDMSGLTKNQGTQASSPVSSSGASMGGGSSSRDPASSGSEEKSKGGHNPESMGAFVSLGGGGGGGSKSSSGSLLGLSGGGSGDLSKELAGIGDGSGLLPADGMQLAQAQGAGEDESMASLENLFLRVRSKIGKISKQQGL